MYQVDIPPSANHILNMYMDFCVRDSGMECALRLSDFYDEKISLLEMQPKMGCSRLKHIPDKYRVLNPWPHLWFVFQIYEDSQAVKIEYIIDDRQNYGSFLR